MPLSCPQTTVLQWLNRDYAVGDATNFAALLRQEQWRLKAQHSRQRALDQAHKPPRATRQAAAGSSAGNNEQAGPAASRPSQRHTRNKRAAADAADAAGRRGPTCQVPGKRSRGGTSNPRVAASKNENSKQQEGGGRTDGEHNTPAPAQGQHTARRPCDDTTPSAQTCKPVACSNGQPPAAQAQQRQYGSQQSLRVACLFSGCGGSALGMQQVCVYASSTACMGLGLHLAKYFTLWS
jgi:hypothetical protein